jgi:lactate dehydrogenase-like 2-hydroxyacid dehydrogenase
MTIDVLSIGSFPAATNSELANRFAVTHHFHQPAPNALSAELRERIRAVATEANRGADRALIAALPRLEVISVFGVGTDNVDVAAAHERDIPVTNTPGILTDEVADLAIGLMLASARQIIFADRYVRDGAWGAKGPIPLGRSVGARPWASSASVASAVPLPIAARRFACASSIAGRAARPRLLTSTSPISSSSRGRATT